MVGSSIYRNRVEQLEEQKIQQYSSYERFKGEYHHHTSTELTEPQSVKQEDDTAAVHSSQGSNPNANLDANPDANPTVQSKIPVVT